MLRTKHSLRHTLYALNLPYSFHFIPFFYRFSNAPVQVGLQLLRQQLPGEAAADKGSLPGYQLACRWESAKNNIGNSNEGMGL